VRYVTVTGGEPLAQPECLALLTVLCDAGYRVSLETSGAIDVAPVDPRVVKVMDLKTPGSGESDKNLYANIEQLRPADQVKFVIGDVADYRWSCDQLRRWDLPARCQVLFSPVAGELEPARLAEWILRDRLDVRFQLQLHKILWGDQPGR
jgi:7-carboxy-7-deazaguanine synthase